MFCQNCGAQMNAGDRTCKRCGATINVNNFQAENGYTCPSCGQWVNTKTWNNES